MANTKKTTTKRTTKTSTKATKVAPKKAEKQAFDRKKYEAIAEMLEVLGKHGVYKFARPIVYKAMAEEKLTKGMMKAYAKEVLNEAKKQKLTWFYENEEVEIDDATEII